MRWCQIQSLSRYSSWINDPTQSLPGYKDWLGNLYKSWRLVEWNTKFVYFTYLYIHKICLGFPNVGFLNFSISNCSKWLLYPFWTESSERKPFTETTPTWSIKSPSGSWSRKVQNHNKRLSAVHAERHCWLLVWLISFLMTWYMNMFFLSQGPLINWFGDLFRLGCRDWCLFQS